VKQTQNQSLTLLIINIAMKTFYTGFLNFDTLLLCFDLLQEKAANLCYNDNGATNFDPHLILNIKSPEVRGSSLSGNNLPWYC